MSLLLKIAKMQKSIDEKPWTEEDKETVNKLIKFFKNTRKQKTLQDAIDIINKRRMQDSMFVGAEMDFLDEPDDLIIRVQNDIKKLSKAQSILEEVLNSSK